MSDHGHDGHHALPVFPPTEVHTTQAELDAMNVPNKFRTQCVDIFVPLWRCWNAKKGWSCDHYKHEWERCTDQLLEQLREKKLASLAAAKTDCNKA